MPSIIIVISLITLIGCAGSQGSTETQPQRSSLQNLHALTPDLYSAAEPVGAPAYEELAALGIRTVISVDGVAPDKQLALSHGIRVVHIPTTYDRISATPSRQLAHAIATMPRPIFVNCHHGKHRGPAAICVGAIGTGEITNEQALAFMRLAGTSPRYTGLWKAAETAKPLSQAQLHDGSIVLVEAAIVEDFVEGMAELSRLGDLLNDCADYGFRAPPDHPDLAPVSLAGQMHNIFRAMEDDPETIEGGPEFLRLLRESRDLASLLETQIEREEIENAHASFKLLMESCSDCHTRYGRDG